MESPSCNCHCPVQLLPNRLCPPRWLPQLAALTRKAMIPVQLPTKDLPHKKTTSGSRSSQKCGKTYKAQVLSSHNSKVIWVEDQPLSCTFDALRTSCHFVSLRVTSCHFSNPRRDDIEAHEDDQQETRHVPTTHRPGGGDLMKKKTVEIQSCNCRLQFW